LNIILTEEAYQRKTQWEERSSGKIWVGQMLEKVIIFYLILTVWWYSYRLIRANNIITELNKDKDKYYQAWKNNSDIIVREKK
jgi:hypothetical protein